MADVTISELEKATVIQDNMLFAVDGTLDSYAVSAAQIKEYVASGGNNTTVISDTSVYTSANQLPDGKFYVYAGVGLLDLPIPNAGTYITVSRPDSLNAMLIAMVEGKIIREYRHNQVNGVWHNWQNFDAGYMWDTSDIKTQSEVESLGFEIGSK